MSKPNIVLQTDFGLTNSFVNSMYGVIKTVDDSLGVYDLNHQVREFDVAQAGGFLATTIPFWPAGTIFVSVVDPGVGTPRRACVAKLANGSYIVTPDNGTLTLPDMRIGIVAVREIDENVNRLKGSEKSHTFHGRDLFAYCAARLAAGVITYEGVGPEYSLDEIVRYKVDTATVKPGRVECEILSALRQFGNLNLSVETDAFEKTGIVHGDKVHVTIVKGGETLFDGDAPYEKSFGYVEMGAPVLFNGSSGTMGFGLNQRNFSQTYLPHIFDQGENCCDYKVTIVKL